MLERVWRIFSAHREPNPVPSLVWIHFGINLYVVLFFCYSQLYTKAEVLGAEDAWHCPNCNLKQEVIKQLGLWTLPDILVVHMKRFKQSSSKPQATSRYTSNRKFSYLKNKYSYTSLSPNWRVRLKCTFNEVQYMKKFSCELGLYFLLYVKQFVIEKFDCTGY